MGEFPPSVPEQVGPANISSASLPPMSTPDYGTLGPRSDVGAYGSAPNRIPGPRRPSHLGPLLAIVIGVVAAILVGAVGRAQHARKDSEKLLSSRSQPAPSQDLRQIDRLRPQKQAEALLELAVGHSEGAVDQISSRVDRWRGKIEWTSQIATLTTAALNSNDMRVRESGVEVELAAYGLTKNEASLEYLLQTVESPDHSQKVWALWALGLMANRSVETERIVEVLQDHLKDPDVDSRRWAVEALALTGGDLTIAPLLKTMHDDPTPLVRERAACGLAESGLFTPQQRFSAVPQLLNYTDDPTLDAQTHAWAFQALADITHQRLANDSAAWRTWYANQ